MEAQLDLLVDNVLHGLILDASQFLLLGFAVVKILASLEEIVRTEEGA